MARICVHSYPDGAEPLTPCVHCGTTKIEAARGLGCIWRDAPDRRSGAVAPEPQLRTPACEDANAITARLAELARERDAILSTPADESGGFL